MQMNRCPKAMADRASTADLLRYCYYYMEYGSFPDGRGMIYQPIPLLDALNVFVNYFRQFEQEEYDRKLKEIQNV